MAHQPDDYFDPKTEVYYYQLEGDLYEYDESEDEYNPVELEDLEDEDPDLYEHLLTVLEECKKIDQTRKSV